MTALNDTLRPCPFCGHAPELSKFMKIFTVRCSNDDCAMLCEASGTNVQVVIDRWNRRRS